MLLQFATNDQYVPQEVAEEISAAAGSSAETRTYEAEHEMNDEARAERDAWLAETLGSPSHWRIGPCQEDRQNPD